MVSALIGKLGRDVADAKVLEINRPAVLLDQQDRAGDFGTGNLVADVIADAREPFRREYVYGWRWRFRASGIGPTRRHGAEQKR